MPTYQNDSKTPQAKVSNNLVENDISDMKTIPGFSNDSFNQRYYNSDQRKRFTKFYGLNDENFKRSTLPQVFGVIASIENRYKSSELKIGHQKNDWVNISTNLKISQVKTGALLHEIILSNQTAGNEVVSALLDIVESSNISKIYY
jgi:hypothetical protein